MPNTGLFFLPTTGADTSPLSELLNILSTKYDPSPLPPWSLQHRLFRETPRPSAENEPTRTAGPRYLQVLSLSHHPGKLYVAITSTAAPPHTRAGTPASSVISGEGSGEPATVISIPSGPQGEEFVQLLGAKFGPLWTQRQALNVKNGQAFDVGDYTVRAGEVMQGYGHGAPALVRGVVVEVEWAGGDGDGDEDEDGEGLVQAFWDILGVKGARECVNVPGAEEEFGSIRQWIELLRIRN